LEICCIQRNPTKGIERDYTPIENVSLNLTVAFKEIPERELRDATFLEIPGIIFAAVHSGFTAGCIHRSPVEDVVFMLPAFLLLAVVGVL
jgi:hypothetical protein